MALRTDHNLRAGLYARVSTEDRGQDPETQLRPLREYAERRGFSVVGAGLCGSERGRLVKAAEGRGIIGGRAPLTGITLVLEPPWCRSPTCSPPWTGSPTRAAARDGATRWPTCCCSRCWPSSRAPPPTAASWSSSPCIASA